MKNGLKQALGYSLILAFWLVLVVTIFSGGRA